MKRATIALALLAWLSACSRDDAPAAAPAAPVAAAAVPAAPAAKADPKAELEAQLMRAVFGDAYRAARGDALAELPDEQTAGAVFAAVQTAAQTLRLPSGDVVLVVAGEQADDNGEPSSSHAASGYLSLYLLRPGNGGWSVLRRHENVARLGSHGSVGTLSWVTLPDGRPLLAAQHGGTWQGYTITALSLFDPAAEKIADLSDIAIHSDSEGGCDPLAGHCWNIEADWRFDADEKGAAYPDLVLVFKGYDEPERPKTEGSDDDTAQPERERRTISGTARYRFTQGKYQLHEGTNLVPGV